MKKSLQLLFLVLISASFAMAQKEHNVWYFGTGAGITFNSGAPVFLAGGQTNVYEGVASICDVSGNLLFYTDGVNVWNKTNTPMPNGNGLLGDNSSTESAIILKMPGSDSLYYIFTAPVVNNAGTIPAAYSIVDLSLNGGLGDVTAKNVTILLPSTEKVTYARNANGTDYWVIYHKWNSSDYYSYRLTSAGFNGTSVISASGQFFGSGSNFNDIGYLKASPCGDKLAMASMGYRTIELLDFNNSTGVVSNGYTIGSSNQVYGTEFSPGGNFLYCTTNAGRAIYQYNLKAGSLSAIAASQTQVGVSSGICNGMQTGPDGKIYIVSQGPNFLSAINNPDVAGTGCNFADSAVACAGGVFGLPNYVAEQFCANLNNKPSALFNTADTILCVGNCAHFNNWSTAATVYKWIFTGGNPGTSADSTPTACYANAGKYDVELIAISGNQSDTLLLKNYITVNPLPVAGTVTSSKNVICAGTGLTSMLAITGYTGNVQWQSSTGGNSFNDIPSADSNVYVTPRTLAQTTTYRAVVSNSCGTDTSNSVTVNIVPAPVALFTYVTNGKQVTFSSSGSSNDVTIYNWDFGDSSANSSEANPVHLYDSLNIYTVCLTVYNGSNCSYTYCIHVDLRPNGIAGVQRPVLISPNPVTGTQLSVSISDNIDLANVQLAVTDVLGRRILNALPNGNPTLLNVGSLCAGTYFLTVQSGNDLIVRKFIKQ